MTIVIYLKKEYNREEQSSLLKKDQFFKGSFMLLFIEKGSVCK